MSDDHRKMFDGEIKDKVLWGTFGGWVMLGQWLKSEDLENLSVQESFNSKVD